MYYYISGKLVKTDAATAVIDNNGIAYILNVSVNTLRVIDGKESVRLYTYFAVREDAQELFGFHSEEELSVFKLLIKIDNVGPKAALAILSVLTPKGLAEAVAASDTKSICMAKGIGKKIAERVVLELKDKLGGASYDTNAESVTPVAEAAGNVSEAINALLVLGYSRQEATKAVGGVDTTGMKIDDIIRAALKSMI